MLRLPSSTLRRYYICPAGPSAPRRRGTQTTCRASPMVPSRAASLEQREVGTMVLVYLLSVQCSGKLALRASRYMRSKPNP
eukprot:scaffold45365_cov61-Phaeocystis_antarctica.AAC.1